MGHPCGRKHLRFLSAVALLALAGFATTGCAVALVGAGAVAGYAVSRDHVELLVDRPYPQTWDVCLEETKRAGLIKDVDPAEGRIEAESRGAHLVVTVERLTETTVKIVVKARKHLLPKIDVAQQLANRIAHRLG